MRRVIKIGGSLLGRPDLTTAFPKWLAHQHSGRHTTDLDQNLCIVGGGAIIDAIRQLDEIHPGDPVQTHWWCVDLLETTARILGSWFDWPRVEDKAALTQSLKNGFSTHRPTLVHVASFYRRDSHQQVASSLPLDWRTTTDSIAAAFARLVKADELVVLKSCEVDAGMSAAELATADIVDKAFPIIAEQLNWRVQMLPTVYE